MLIIKAPTLYSLHYTELADAYNYTGMSMCSSWFQVRFGLPSGMASQGPGDLIADIPALACAVPSPQLRAVSEGLIQGHLGFEPSCVACPRDSVISLISMQDLPGHATPSCNFALKLHMVSKLRLMTELSKQS